MNILNADDEAIRRGVTAVSAGNHAIAVAYAAREFGTSARVVMLQSANAARVDRCRRYGAEIEFSSDGKSGFARAQEIEREDERLYIHPFEGVHTTLGTSTVGLELAEDLPSVEAVVVPIGGGGLISGVAAAIKQHLPGWHMLHRSQGGRTRQRRRHTRGSSVGMLPRLADCKVHRTLRWPYRVDPCQAVPNPVHPRF